MLAMGARAAQAETLNRCPGDAALEHLVVIFDENVSFDHYFGTYPVAANPKDKAEPRFDAKPDTPTVNGLSSAGLWARNPNSEQPFRLDRNQYATSDQDHSYREEQEAFDNGLMDLFPESTGSVNYGPEYGHGKGIVMGVYDGNTVTALWNYAQNFAMSDNSFGTSFGPSTPGALNLVAGRTGPVAESNGMPAGKDVVNPGKLTGEGGVVIGDSDPLFDVCSNPNKYKVSIAGPNIGDLLSKENVTWGWFQGGFRPVDPNLPEGRGKCTSTHKNLGGYEISDYVPHHEPFQYFKSTSNRDHKAPNPDAIGTNSDGANHQYDLRDFFTAIDKHQMPTVSFLKPAAYQNGHAGIEIQSDPLDEQKFLVDTINRIETLPEWSKTAIVIMWDDSDGWYDHVMGPIVNQSDTPYDSLSGTQSPRDVASPKRVASGACGSADSKLSSPGRCGYGPRLPLLIISPFAKVNFVDHSVTDQSSVIRYIEDRWLGGQRLGVASNPSTDAIAGSLCGMFDFKRTKPADLIFLDPNQGTVMERSELRPSRDHDRSAEAPPVKSPGSM
jgi:phospholipase C